MEKQTIHPDDIRKMKRYLDDYLRIKGKALRQKNTYYCLCHAEKTPSLKSFWANNNAEQGIRKAKCFSCGRVFDVYDLVGVLEGVEGLKNQYNRLCKVLNMASIEIKAYSVEQQDMQLKGKPTAEEIVKYLAGCDSDQGIYYWQQRGLGEAIVQAYGLTYDPIKNALVIPVTEQGYILRYLNHPKYRYIKSVGLNDYFKSKNNNPSLPIILCEGEIDALSLIELGYPNVIALGSISNLVNVYETLVTTQNIDIIIAVDLDDAGKKWTQELVETCLSMNWRKPINIWDWLPIPDGKVCKDINDYLLADRASLKEYIGLVKKSYGG